jgi:hypothetical protein
MAHYIQLVVQKIETTEGLASTTQCHLLMLSIELLALLREALDIHVFEGRATTWMEHGIQDLDGIARSARRKFGVLVPKHQFQGPLM